MPKDPYKVLGISRNATLEEIKKKYKDLLKIYHPDTPDTGSTTKTQEINIAYQEICKKLERKKNTFKSEEAKKDLSSIKNKKIRVIECYISELDLLQLNYTLLVDYQEQIVNIVQNTRKIRNSDDIVQVNSLYQETISQLNKLYWQIVKDFCKKNAIPAEFIQGEIRYNCKLNELINQLEDIKKEYKEKKIKDKIEEITNNYKSYTGYAFLEENIKSIIKNFVEKEKEKELDQITMAPLCQEIEALFARYYKNLEKINTILKEDLTEEETQEVKELNANILNANFNQMYRKWKAKRDKPIIMALFEEIRNKATAAALELLKNNDIEGLIAINKKEKEMIEIIQKMLQGELDLEELRKLEYIDFKNIDVPTTDKVLFNADSQLEADLLKENIDIEAINSIYEEELEKKH